MRELFKNREVIFEFTQTGTIVRVTALDTATLTEIVIQGPAHAGKEALRRAALSRLDYVLRKQHLL